MTIPIKQDGGIDWFQVYRDAERDAFAQARSFLANAKFCDPDKYPSDRYWRDYFVKEARRYNQCGVWHRRKAKEFANV